MKKKLIIFGDQAYSDIVYEYFTHDSPYEIVAFTLDKKYITKETHHGLPVVPFEEVEKLYPPETHEFHAAVYYAEINRLRAITCQRAKEKGYKLASYISSRAFIWHNVKVGEHAFICEDNTIQPFVTIGNNAIIWSGNHIGHHSKIGNNCFISSHVVISGFCSIGDNSFLGVNASIGNHLKIGKECWVGQGAVISRDVPDTSIVKSPQSEVSALDIERLVKYLDKVKAKIT